MPAELAERITVGVAPADVCQAVSDVKLGRVFTGKVARNQPQANREGMLTTLARLKQELETS